MPAPTIGVVGAGTMGAGIAQVAAVAGDQVLLADAIPGAAERAIGRIRDQVRAQAARGRTDADADALSLRAADLADLGGCDVVVEAVVEDLPAKRALFADLERVVSDGCLLASNSSSFSPTAMAAGLTRPERLVGLHFFNPVPAMRLAEVISGLATAPETADRAAALARAWGKTVVRSAATPGFIVNRIARPFYAEAWRLLEENAAPAEVIDAVLTGGGSFRMGPFALMDLIGHDVNEAVTRSVWAALGHDPRFAPSLCQRALVEAGWLGKKAGRGCFPAAGAPDPVPAPPVQSPPAVIVHGESPLLPLVKRAGVDASQVSGAATRGGLPGSVELPSGAALVLCDGTAAAVLATAAARPVIVVDRVLDPATAKAVAVAASPGCPRSALVEATGLLQAAALDVFVIGDVPGLIVTRTVAMLANLAIDAVACDVASPDDIDSAMRLGVSYPLGPLAWARQWGAPEVLAILDSLESWYRDGRYRPSPLLRLAALPGGSLPGGEP